MSREFYDFRVRVTEGDEPYDKRVVIWDIPDPHGLYKSIRIVSTDEPYDFRVRIIVVPNDNYDMWVKVINPEALPEKYNPEPTIYYHPEPSLMGYGQRYVIKHRGEWYETEYGRFYNKRYLGPKWGLTKVPHDEARTVPIPWHLLS